MHYRQRSGILNPFVTLLALVLLVVALACGLPAGCGPRQENDRRGANDDHGADSKPRTGAEPDGNSTQAGGVLRDEEAAAAHILITYAGCPGAPPDITRTRTEAYDLALRVLMKVRERGADFAELARRYSEDPTAERTGGYLGIFHRGDMELEFDVAVFGLEENQVSGVVETRYGFHIIKRLPVRRTIAHHILIAWKGAAGATGAVKRTQAQAKALADEIQLQAAAAGADLCELVRKFTDDPHNRTRCGSLGIVEPGLLPPAFDDALFRLRPGSVSKVIETEYGYHIIWREELPRP
jgi:peptidyl-prolyl cis-trans isomerase SurA